jgi:acyl-CoA synthetase (AMP-forming)/AMP-acid ligase II
MTNSFGQSEAGLNITFFSPEDHVKVLKSGDERRLSSVGRATLFTRVEIMDDDGNLLPPESVGEIVMRGDQLMTGYYKNEEETAAANAHGWRHTGDLGFKDAEGWIFLVDRKRDMIITGGFNVFPAEIEKVLLAHPAVQDCAVVGAPDEEWGERVTAVVELKSGATADSAELLAFARKRLSGVKAPKAVQFVAELPRSPVGKLLRRKVREPFWAGRERKI